VPINPRRTAVIAAVLAVLTSAAGIGVYQVLQHVTAAQPPAPGCQAGTGSQVISLDTGQAGIAATIAGVAVRHKLPRQALTIALATALQESDLENLSYGDRDSVGVFQQRPSQGWGTAANLQNPIYATTKFFAALVQVPRYTKIPVDQAAQDVQHSADGAAYSQYDYVAALLAADFTGQHAHEVTCWYTPATPAPRPRLTAAAAGLRQTFGPDGDRAVVGISTVRSFKIAVERGSAWTVAAWLVTHAEEYQLSEVRYAGFRWKAADGSMGWQRDPDPNGVAPGSIVAG
jgi:hypothetical protein